VGIFLKICLVLLVLLTFTESIRNTLVDYCEEWEISADTEKLEEEKDSKETEQEEETESKEQDNSKSGFQSPSDFKYVHVLRYHHLKCMFILDTAIPASPFSSLETPPPKA
jgi:hypothetical protein